MPMKPVLSICAAAGTLCAAMLFMGFASGLAPDEGNWPYWRGPAADGMAVGGAPLHWSDTQNVRWKTEIPGRGNSSPVVWGNRIFLTTCRNAVRGGFLASTQQYQS